MRPPLIEDAVVEILGGVATRMALESGAMGVALTVLAIGSAFGGVVTEGALWDASTIFLRSRISDSTISRSSFPWIADIPLLHTVSVLVPVASAPSNTYEFETSVFDDTPSLNPFIAGDAKASAMVGAVITLRIFNEVGELDEGVL
jgi:hypothetical protein